MTNKTKFYKIRHKETGRFYQPVKGRWDHDKTNLGPNGKVYYKIPNLGDLIGAYSMQVPNPDYGKLDPIGFKISNRTTEKRVKYKKDDFEIVEYTVIETVLREQI